MKNTLLSLFTCALIFSISCGGENEEVNPQSNKINENIPEILWSEVMGGSTAASGGTIRFDGASNIYLAGVYDGDPQIALLPVVTKGLPNGFLLKLNTDGDIPLVQDLGLSVSRDLDYLAFTDNSILLSGTYIPSANDVFYFELDGNGGQLGTKIISGSSSNDKAGGVAVDTQGNILLGGTYRGTIYYDNGDILGANILGSASVVKLNPAGEAQWSYISQGRSLLYNVAVDEAGNVYLNQAVFPSSCETEIIKLDPEGNLVWAKTFGLACGKGLSVISSNEIYFNHQGGVGRLNSNGEMVWHIDASQFVFMSDMSANASGDIVVTGSYVSAGTFGNIEIPNSPTGSSTPFIAMLNSDGSVRWMTDETPANRVSVDARGRVAYAFFANSQTNYGMMR